MTEREVLKKLIKLSYRVIIESNDLFDPWDNGKTGEAFKGCSGHPRYGKIMSEFEKVWTEAIKTLGLNPKDMAIVSDFNKWIDEA